MFSLPFFLAVMLASAALAAGPSAGDKVVVAKPAELKTTTGKTVPLTPGMTLDVLEVEGERIKVSTGRLGWVDPTAVIPASEADAHFTKAIEANPADASAWSARGRLRFDKGEHDKAIADLDRALELAPNSNDLTIRGFAWKRKGEKDKAMADFNEAIKLNPQEALAWRVRGATWASKADYPKALAEYSESIRLDPENPDSLHHRVVMLSVCTDDKIRNGQQALKDATAACEISGWKNPLYLSGLAFAYAELGDFDAAVKWFTTAMERSGPTRSEAMRPRLEQLRRKEPIRSTWK